MLNEHSLANNNNNKKKKHVETSVYNSISLYNLFVQINDLFNSFFRIVLIPLTHFNYKLNTLNCTIHKRKNNTCRFKY